MDDQQLKKMHEEQGFRRIDELNRKIDTTAYNLEVSEEILAGTPSDAHRDRLRGKNTQRRHAIGSMQKEIRDIEQTMQTRSREKST